MIQFMQLLQAKLPPGFSITFTNGSLGLRIEIIHMRSKIRVEQYVSEMEITVLMAENEKAVVDAVITESIRKIRNHKNYTKRPRT